MKISFISTILLSLVSLAIGQDQGLYIPKTIDTNPREGFARLKPLEERYSLRLENVRQQFASADPPLNDGFGSLSIENTEHPASRYNGGLLDWIEKQKYPDPFRTAVAEIAADLSPGELSQVIIRKEGTFLVRLIESKAGETKSFEQIEPQLRQQLLRETRERLTKDFEEMLVKDAKVTIYPENLKHVADFPIRKPSDATFSPED